MKTSSLLRDLADRYGFADIIYVLDLKLTEENTKQQRSLFIPKRKGILFSSKNAIRYSICSRKKWAGKDSNIELSFKKPVHIWSYYHLSGRSPQDELLKYGYKFKVSINVACAMNSELVGRFYLLYNDEGLLGSSEAIAELQSELTDLHYLLIAEEQSYLNPLVDYRVVNQRDLEILSHVAAGRNREAIATACNLTARGVDYRIARLKERLQARNNANLIRIGYANGLISETNA